MIKAESSRSAYFIILVVAIIILVAVGVFIGKSLTGDKGEVSRYSAVYLTSGDIYFGQLSWFPWPRLKDAWYIDAGVNPQTQAQEVNLLPLSSVFWGPSGNLKLNPKEIVFTTPLRADSQVVSILDGGGSQTPANQLPPATDTQSNELLEPAQ